MVDRWFQLLLQKFFSTPWSLDRIEAWGEEYDQPLPSGYAAEGEPGRSRKVSKVLKTQSWHLGFNLVTSQVDFEAPPERQENQRIRKTSKVSSLKQNKNVWLMYFFKSQVEFCSPQKIVGGGGEKSGSLTRSKIAAGRTLPDYSWCAILFFWRSSIAVIYSLVQIFRPILILEPQTLLITLPDYSWSALWPIAVSSYISGTGAESC